MALSLRSSAKLCPQAASGSWAKLASNGHQQRRYESEQASAKPLRNAHLDTLRKGKGGRSSFNGNVCTVFGATGFMGRYVCNLLGKSGTQIIVPYRGESGTIRHIKLMGDLGQVLFQPFHLRDEASIRKAMKYSNIVINLVGRDWETMNFKFDDVHAKGARMIAKAARECGVEKLIHVSSLNVSENPPRVLKGLYPHAFIADGGSRFLSSKWKGEQAVLDEFPDAIIVRPSDVYGQEDRFLSYYSHQWRRKHVYFGPPPISYALQIQGIPLWEKGEKTIKQPVWVGDVARGIIALINDKEVNGGVYEFVGPKRYLLSELVDYFLRVMRQDSPNNFGPLKDIGGYKRLDLKFAPLFQLKVTLNEMLSTSWPIACMTWDKMEREHLTDEVTGCPTLEDVGVAPTPMEERIHWELKKYFNYSHWDPNYGIVERPHPPRTVSETA